MKEIFGKINGLDERSFKSLLKTLENANLPGFDYLEFKQSVAGLEKMGMDEPTAMRSAFTTASTMGLNKSKLISTANHYKDVLIRELKVFDQTCQKQMDLKVNGKKKEVELLKIQIEKDKAEIAKLEARISKNQLTLDNADGDIERETQKIINTKEAFEKTFLSVSNQIEKDISTIDSVLF